MLIGHVLLVSDDTQLAGGSGRLARQGDARGPQRSRGAFVLLRPDDEGRGDPEGGGEDRELRADGQRFAVRGEGEHRDRRALLRTAALEIQVHQPELVQRPAHAPGVDDSRLVFGQQLGPAGSVGRMTGGDRRDHRDPDGVRDVIARPQPPVTTASRERGQRPGQGAD